MLSCSSTKKTESIPDPRPPRLFDSIPILPMKNRRSLYLLLWVACGSTGVVVAQESSRAAETPPNTTTAASLVMKEVPEFRNDAGRREVRPNGSIALLRGEPSSLPDPEPPSQPVLLSMDRQVLLEAGRTNLARRPIQKMLALSATGVDGQRSSVRWYALGSGETYEAWSNVDFGYYSGFCSFESEGVEWTFLMAIGAVPRERGDQMTWLPSLPAEGFGEAPAFVVTRGNGQDREAPAPIRGLHELFSRNKGKPIAARERREVDQLIRREEERLRAAVPKHTVMWFRPRKGSRYLENPAGAVR